MRPVMIEASLTKNVTEKQSATIWTKIDKVEN